ncbi:16S rRNA (adenine(1518)-N(6)/adenine(1519)-N(6))-dimethyltransferase RsmA [Spiroplasma endosymbiont of Labia minor]|uniref:16S rRNA (adenine(1518)-N(6)/adenine(1519)-N(6))- dimethyltransferase RsmA n=1 Tax=Spiroplasma endosymbiont of Labia minor TaxID=3066305 RepID=UPI0030D1F3B0
MIAKKQFGQNFITDKNLIGKIISLLGDKKEMLIIEIGPGRGALTRNLVRKFSQVIAIEIDRDLEIYLKSEIKDSNFELVMKDVLDLNLDEFIKTKNINNFPVAIISNLPYYITSEILFKVFSSSHKIVSAIFMMQKEVAERITSKVDGKKYNNLTVISNYFSKPKYEFTVKRNLFNPEPKVDSAIVSFDFSKSLSKNYEFDIFFTKTIRKLFNNKRKTILNNLQNVLITKKDGQNILKNVDIDINLRPENISIEEFILLIEEIQKWK